MTPRDAPPPHGPTNQHLNLGTLSAALATLRWSDYYTRLADGWFAYRATAPAITTFGHVHISCAIAQLTPTQEDRADHLRLDRIPYMGFTERLILLRRATEPVHVLTESEYRAATQQLVP